MVLKPEPIFAAVESLDPDRGRVLLLSPAGRRLDQALVRELSGETHLTLLCGRYEGVDERVVEGLPAEEVSIGDYVLAGGEVPALVVIEAVTRLIPGVIGKDESHEQDSFAEPGVLDHPQYTRPAEFRGMAVPEVLRSGDHGAVERWRREAARAKATAQPPRSRLALSGRVEARWYPCSPAMNTTDLVEQSYLRKGLPQFRPGDTVKVHVRVVEGNRERVQVFQGVVIRRSGGGLRETFTVRKISFGVGVERTFPLHSPSIAKLEVAQHGHVRRAKLYYLRDLRGKKARIKERRIDEAKLAAMEEMRAEEEAMGAAEAEEGSMETLEEAETLAELESADEGDTTDEQPAEAQDGAEVASVSEADASADEAEERAEA